MKKVKPKQIPLINNYLRKAAVFFNKYDNCGFGDKSKKIGTVDAKKILIDFRYGAKLQFPHGALKFEKSTFAHFDWWPSWIWSFYGHQGKKLSLALYLKSFSTSLTLTMPI